MTSKPEQLDLFDSMSRAPTRPQQDPFSSASSDALARLRALPGYELLGGVLDAALEQAQLGKGKERHAAPTGVELPFEQQPICTLARVYGIGYNLGQAAKKAHEAQHLPKERAQAELLGAINYLAAAYIILGEEQS